MFYVPYISLWTKKSFFNVGFKFLFFSLKLSSSLFFFFWNNFLSRKIFLGKDDHVKEEKLDLFFVNK